MNMDAWRQLVDCDPKPHTPAPTRIQFPDGTIGYLSRSGIAGDTAHWKYLMREVVKWLADNGHLRPEHCPIGTPRARTRYIVNTVPEHPRREGKVVAFSSADRLRLGDFYIETHWPARQTVRYTLDVVRRVSPELLLDFRLR